MSHPSKKRLWKLKICITDAQSSTVLWEDKGKLSMWGNARDCRLGVPRLPEAQPSPIEVKFLMDDEELGHVLGLKDARISDLKFHLPSAGKLHAVAMKKLKGSLEDLHLLRRRPCQSADGEVRF